MREIFVNRAWSTLNGGIDAVTVTLPLTTGQGARFGTIAAGEKIRIVFLNATLNVSEIAYMTAISGDNATIVRGTPAAAHLSGDRVEARIGKETMTSLTQAPDIQEGAPTSLGTIAGTDTITAAATPTLLAQPAAGSLWKLLAAGANTGAATLNIDGLGALSILRPDGSALQASDIPLANYPCLLYKRAGDFILTNPANLIAQIVNAIAKSLAEQTHTAFTTAGTATAFTLTPTLPITALAAGQRYRVKFHVTAGAAPTLAVSGLAAAALVQYDNTAGTKVACSASTIVAGLLTDVEYDGVSFVVLDPVPIVTHATLDAGSSAITMPIGNNDVRLATTAYADTHVPKDFNVALPVGIACEMYITVSIVVNPLLTTAGSNLSFRYKAGGGINNFIVASGTWRNITGIQASSSGVNVDSGLFQRIA